MALTEIQKDKSLLEDSKKESQEEIKKKLQKEIKKKLKDSEKEIPFKILTAYRYLGVLEKTGVTWKDMGIPTIGSEQSISERVKQYLRDQEKILPKVTAKYLLERTFGKDEDEKSLREIYELHLKSPGMPLLESEKVLFEAVTDGVKSGFVGVKEDTKVYYMEQVTPDLDSIVIRGEIAKKMKEEELREKKEKEEEVLPEKEKVDREREEKKEGIVRNLELRAAIQWDKLSSLINGVIRPLKEKGLPPEIIIEIKATSEEGFDRNTLDTKVRETLQQIGEIKKWEEN